MTFEDWARGHGISMDDWELYGTFRMAYEEGWQAGADQALWEGA